MLSDQNARKSEFGEEAKTTFDLIESLAKEELVRELELRRLDQESLNLIAQLQLEEAQAAEIRRQEKEAADKEQLTCKICLSGLFESELGEGNEGEVMPLQLCEHIFHGECLENYLMTQIAYARFPLNCPDSSCKLEIGDLNLKKLLAEAEYALDVWRALDDVRKANK